LKLTDQNLFESRVAEIACPSLNIWLVGELFPAVAQHLIDCEFITMLKIFEILLGQQLTFCKKLDGFGARGRR
jgi:hypothetical protein